MTHDELVEQVALAFYNEWCRRIQVRPVKSISTNQTFACNISRRGAAYAVALALEEAAKIAETQGVYPELNVYDGGPEWYRHGREIASSIRALKGE
jgi:hypothetical protein